MTPPPSTYIRRSVPIAFLVARSAPVPPIHLPSVHVCPSRPRLRSPIGLFIFPFTHLFVFSRMTALRWVIMPDSPYSDRKVPVTGFPLSLSPSLSPILSCFLSRSHSLALPIGHPRISEFTWIFVRRQCTVNGRGKGERREKAERSMINMETDMCI